MESVVAQMKSMDGEMFQRLVVNGARSLKSNLQMVNDLNVFPIPDGDTGDNMYKTLYGGVKNLGSTQETSIAKTSETLASGMLLNARGNSGVILSQLFAGLANGLANCETASVQEFANAMKQGVAQAYKAVSKPVEGTILTVAREAAEVALKNVHSESTFGSYLDDYVSEMKQSLERTPELLPVLKEADVIDSGGAGLLCIAQGMQEAVKGDISTMELTDEIAVSDAESGGKNSLDFSSFNEESKMEYGYCTELLLQLLSAKGDVNAFSVDELIAYLESIGGDSIVAFRTGSVIKLHVHTFTPYKVLEYCQKYGEFLTVKIENMTLQHNEVIAQKPQETMVKKAKKRKERREFALVTVASGKGLAEVFTECGADEVIDGGQGKNPSIERFIEAFEYVNADHIFVLPNNSNIIMAAKQAAELYPDSCVHVLETKNVGQAYSILSMLDYSLGNADEIIAQMLENMQSVQTGMITVSVRDTALDGVEIQKGDYIAFTDKTMLAAEKTKVAAFKRLSEKLQVQNKEYMVAVYGESLGQADRREVKAWIEKQYPNLEYYELDGGQEVYDFIVIVE